MLEQNKESIDNEGNKYYFLILTKDNTWEAIHHSFLIVRDIEGTLIGQFISSIWYNEQIPDRDYHVAVVKINAAKVGTIMPTLLSDMNKIIQEERVETNPYIIIYHVFTKSILTEIGNKLKNETQITEYYRQPLKGKEISMNFLGRKIGNTFYTSMYCPGFVLNIK